MLITKNWGAISVITLLAIISVFVVMHRIDDIPSNLADKIDEKVNGKISSLVLMNSDTGKIAYLKHKDSEIETVYPLQVSEIRKITSVSVVGVSGIEAEGKKYYSCNYITIDSHRELVCSNNEQQEFEELTSKGVPDKLILPDDVANQLGEAGGIENINFLIVSDIETGEVKLLKRENLVNLSTNLPQPIEKITSSKVWNIVNFKKNPCCELVTIDGKEEVICRKNTVCKK